MSETDERRGEQISEKRNGGSWTRWLRYQDLVILTVIVLLVGLVIEARGQRVPGRVLPGEFESQDVLMLAWPGNRAARPEERAAHRQVLTDIISAVDGSIRVVVLVPDLPGQPLPEFLVPPGSSDRVRFLPASNPTIWVRDFGPLVAKSFAGGYEAVDTVYRDRQLDTVPSTLSGPLGLRHVAAPILMENGNVISNGAGLCVTTEKLLDQNLGQGRQQQDVDDLLRRYFGASQVVYLENLVGELNGHVDMFMTFTAPDTAIVGEYSRGHDPVNAAILDRNARRLSILHTACGPLKVHRIPMPNRRDGLWRTYTNVVYANRVLLLPSYGESERQSEEIARAVYRELLPTWKIVPIDCSGLIRGGGALRCVTMNVYHAPPSS